MDPDVFLAAAGVAQQWIDSDAVATRWDELSALAGYTVAGLAGHLARAVLTVEPYLDAPAPAAESGDTDDTDAAGYFATVLGTDDPIDSERHQRIRQRGIDTAADGPGEPPAEAVDVAAAVLARVAVRRAGGLVTVRSLAHRERQPDPVRAL